MGLCGDFTEIINKNCPFLLARINSELRRREPEIRDGTVAKTSDGTLFRVEVARPPPADRYRPDVLNKRVD